MVGQIHPLRPVPLRRKFIASRTVLALVLREMATTYGRSPGGYIWAVLEPCLGIILLTAIFSTAFDAPPLGDSFPIFYASGLVPFTVFVALNSKIGTALVFSKPFLAYPSVTFIDVLLARFLINAITQIMVAYLIFGIVVTLRLGFREISRYSRHLSSAEPYVGCVYHHTKQQ